MHRSNQAKVKKLVEAIIQIQESTGFQRGYYEGIELGVPMQCFDRSLICDSSGNAIPSWLMPEWAARLLIEFNDCTSNKNWPEIQALFVKFAKSLPRLTYRSWKTIKLKTVRQMLVNCLWQDYYGIAKKAIILVDLELKSGRSSPAKRRKLFNVYFKKRYCAVGYLTEAIVNDDIFDASKKSAMISQIIKSDGFELSGSFDMALESAWDNLSITFFNAAIEEALSVGRD